MKIGKRIEPIIELINNLTDCDHDKALKILSLVVVEYMLSADCTEF